MLSISSVTVVLAKGYEPSQDPGYTSLLFTCWHFLFLLALAHASRLQERLSLMPCSVRPPSYVLCEL